MEQPTHPVCCWGSKLSIACGFLAGSLVAVLREVMKARLMQLEEALFIASGQRFEAESEAAAEAIYLKAGRSRCTSLSTIQPLALDVAFNVNQADFCKQ